MTKFEIPKRNGKMRVIFAPSPEEKIALRALVPALTARAQELDVNDVCHGFMPGRSPSTNALQHVGWEFTLSMDLESFFDSVTPAHFEGVDIPAICFVDGATRQGLPTSPALSNIAAMPMDQDILALNRTAGRFGRMFVYTRYCDDLCFSFRNPWVAKYLEAEVTKLAEKHGFKVNPEKTKLQCAKAGRRIITGIAVDDKGIYPTREAKRRLRAAEHQSAIGSIRPRTLAKLRARREELFKAGGVRFPLFVLLRWQARGLAEWLRCKLPNDWSRPGSVTTQARANQEAKKGTPATKQQGVVRKFMRRFFLGE